MGAVSSEEPGDESHARVSTMCVRKKRAWSLGQELHREKSVGRRAPCAGSHVRVRADVLSVGRSMAGILRARNLVCGESAH